MNNKNKKLDQSNKVANGTTQIAESVENNIPNKKFYYMSVEEFEKKFHFYENNRGKGTDRERAEEMAYDIANNNTGWMITPVCVDPKSKTILDHNHLAMAMIIAHKEYGVQLEIPVLEMEFQKISVCKAVQLLNNSSKQWTLEMYILNYIKEGYADYKRLREMAETLGVFFMEEDGKIRWRYLTALAGKSQQEKLRDGTYTLTTAQMNEQIKLGREIQEVWKAANKPKVAAWLESFIFAYYKIRNDKGKSFNLNRMLKAIENHKEMFDGAQSAKIWCERLVDYYDNTFDF